jgi:hypothetical protein
VNFAKIDGGFIWDLKRHWVMGRNPNQDPDLFSTAASPSPNQAPVRVPGRPSRRPALPKDLPKAISYLADEELDWLLRTAIQEANRRGRPIPLPAEAPTNRPAASSTPVPEQTKPPARPTQSGVAPTGLTRGQMNAVRAAFKAGITPARIARQFGISQSNVRKALATDQPKR